MRTRLATGAAAVAVAATLLMPSAASAAPTTQVIQGEVLRLVSVADWDAASRLLPGVPVQWDVEVSAEAPDPGVVRIGVSARGSATLVLDVSRCADAWKGGNCPGGATVLRSDWSIPRDGTEVALTEIADTAVVYLRLAITLDPADLGGSTDIRVHAQGAGESAVIGPDGGLATTGLSQAVPGALWAGAVLVVAGGMTAILRRRRADRDETVSE
ncbi:hypothetical protein [Microbacterium sp. SA39]|uniref:hypothetical protein n=1 Tax=Microbacterium sp. SA39 TaxID=1263625 RepID=UPI00061DF59C|nr:hypothetical protein [Microbacterium sp. SA39]KJQ54124.1 hypothetical protein RS85_02195 [Microbacterium sp. SA39]